jgi:hypothetical protein
VLLEADLKNQGTEHLYILHMNTWRPGELASHTITDVAHAMLLKPAEQQHVRLGGNVPEASKLSSILSILQARLLAGTFELQTQRRLV